MCSQSSDSEGSGSSVSSGDKAATSAATRNSDSDSTDTEAESVVTEGASRSEVEDSPDQVWEICCHPRSRLTRCCRLAGLVCRRLTLETGYDFALAKASSKALQLAERKKSKIFWISVPCKAYSPLQNMRKYGNTAKSRKVLARKQADTDKIVENTLSPCKPAVLEGQHVYFEWSTRCFGWSRCHPVLNFLKWLDAHHIPWFKVRVHSCAWNSRSSVSGQLMHKSRLPQDKDYGGSLEIKLSTIWTDENDEKQRWEESKEERRSENRVRGRCRFAKS